MAEGGRAIRRFLPGLGVCAALCVVFLFAAMSRHLATVTGRMNGDARRYAERAVTAITAHWDVQALRDLAGPAMLSGTSDTSLASAFSRYRQLGVLVKAHGCDMQSLTYTSATDKPSWADARYRCTAEYENGSAELELTLFKQDTGWKINGFQVDADALEALPPAVKL